MTTTTHPDLPFGRVIGRFLYAMPDTEDLDRMPDAFPAVGSITITSMQEVIKAELPVPTTVIRTVYTYDLDAEGYLVDKQGNQGVWLIEGAYKVSYNILGATIKSHDILVLSGNDADHPIDLLYAQPPGGPVLTASQYAELNARLSALEMTSVGLHASSHATDGSDPIAPESIGALRAVATPDVSGHVDNILEPGTHRILAADATVENGYPSLPESFTVLYLQVEKYIKTNDSYFVQHLYDQSGRSAWMRTRYGAWGSWRRQDPGAVTPASIGAVTAKSTELAAGADLNTLLTPGRYTMGNSTASTTALNYPFTGFAGHIEVIGYSSSFLVQRATYFYGGANFGVWVRTRYGSWQPWEKLVTDDDPRLRETSWRALTTHDTNGVVSGTPYDTSWAPQSGIAGGVWIKRVQSLVTIQVVGMTFNSGTVDLALPSGFRIANRGAGHVMSWPIWSSGSALVRGSGGWLYVTAPSGTNTNSYACGSTWITDDPFPSEPYPGTPA